MNILTIDTAFDTMYLTIGTDEKVEEYKILENTKEKYHSAFIIPEIINLLKKTGRLVKDIDALGVNIGPGSFTGLRVSVTIARTMAQNLNIPVVGVSSLQILSLFNNSNKQSLCLLDAKKGKVYVGIYFPDGSEAKSPTTIGYENISELIKNSNYFLITDKIISEKLDLTGVENIIIDKILSGYENFLAKLSYNYLKQENIEQYKWFNLKPLYIQPPPITMPKVRPQFL